jgi:hypothetical protein
LNKFRCVITRILNNPFSYYRIRGGSSVNRIFSIYNSRATVEQSSTKKQGFTGIALQLTLISAAKCSCSGAFVSVTLIVCEAVDELPHVAVQVLVTEYEPAHEPLVVISAEVNVKEPQASVAVATANTGVAGQSIVEVAGKAAITGAVLSCTLIVCEAR